MTENRLKDLARIMRSKNAGPFELTFDVMFDDPAVYERVKRSGVLEPAGLARLYRSSFEDVLACMFFDPALAFKFTLRRGWEQGAIAERDTFGAQQYAPLLNIIVP